MAKVSEHEMRRRELVAAAGSLIYDAMVEATERNGELSGWEWMRAFADVQEQFIGRELAREWRCRAEEGGDHVRR